MFTDNQLTFGYEKMNLHSQGGLIDFMNMQSVIILLFSLYLLVGLILAYYFVTKEIPEIFEEDLNEEEDVEYIRSRNELYDALHNFEKLAGSKGILIFFYLGGMFFWLPIWFYIRVKKLF
ncbi:hypothetical protein SAMN05444162_3050 [Paenibacillaceae bacterium GAS479]|nr:hypothetical protein SAMN05444162_3050 [Paenibacillaceae bacterium GAS479]